MAEVGPSNPAELRGVGRRAGAMVLTALVLIITGVLLAAYRQHWFAAVEKVTVLMPARGTFGLSDGAPVELLGRPVGAVRDINLDADGRILAHVLIRKEFMPFIRQDSKALLRLRFGVVGDAYIEITRGTGESFDPRTDLLPAEPYEDVIQTARILLQKMNDPQGSFNRILENLAKLSDALGQDKPALLELLNDKEFVRELRQTVIEGRSALKQVPAALASLALMGKSLESSAVSFQIMDVEMKAIAEQLQETRKGLDRISGTLQKEMKELPGAMSRLNEVLTDVQPVVRSLTATTERLPKLIESMQSALELVPDLILQAQYALSIVERAFERIDLMLGGPFALFGRHPPAPPTRLPPSDVQNSGDQP